MFLKKVSELFCLNYYQIIPLRSLKMNNMTKTCRKNFRTRRKLFIFQILNATIKKKNHTRVLLALVNPNKT